VRRALLQNVDQVAAGFRYASLFTSHDVFCLDRIRARVFSRSCESRKDGANKVFDSALNTVMTGAIGLCAGAIRDADICPAAAWLPINIPSSRIKRCVSRDFRPANSCLPLRRRRYGFRCGLQTPFANAVDWGSGLLFARNRIARNEIEIRILRLRFACLFQYGHSWTCSNSRRRSTLDALLYPWVLILQKSSASFKSKWNSRLKRGELGKGHWLAPKYLTFESTICAQPMPHV
jgi:hypothetical protein